MKGRFFVYNLFLLLSCFRMFFHVNILKIKTKQAIKKQTKINKMKKTEAEWKRDLTDHQYKILREKGTERAFTGKYDGHYEEGIYECWLWQSTFSVRNKI